MSLKIQSTDTDLKALIDKIEKINTDKGEEVSAVTIVEFQEIRNQADLETATVTSPSVLEGLAAVQKLADDLVETMQKVALAARKSKLSSPPSKDPALEAENLNKITQLTALKRAIEFQLAYVVVGYKSSVERL